MLYYYVHRDISKIKHFSNIVDKEPPDDGKHYTNENWVAKNRIKKTDWLTTYIFA